jgi:hypothetical protein
MLLLLPKGYVMPPEEQRNIDEKFLTKFLPLIKSAFTVKNKRTWKSVKEKKEENVTKDYQLIVDIGKVREEKEQLLSQNAGSFFVDYYDQQLKQYDSLSKNFVELNPTSYIREDNTSDCESAHALHSKIHPKDLYCMDLFPGLVGITVLLWNLGYKETLSRMSQELNIRVSDKLLAKYQQNDNK